MKKYFSIFKAELLNSLQYLSNVVFGVTSFFVFVFIMFNIWQVIYSDPKELINGYTMHQMVWYILITEIIYKSVEQRKLCREISKDIKTGNISYNLNKPYNYILYSFFRQSGRTFINLVSYLIIGISLGILMLKEIPSLDFIIIVMFLLIAILAEAIATLIVIMIGLFSFYFEDSSPMLWMYSKLILVFGTIFPIEFFPEWIQGFLKYSPVYVTSYGPAKMFIKFELGEGIGILLSQIVYVVISYSLCQLIYSKAFKRLVINGG